MEAIVKIDKKGRIVIPKSFRESIDLKKVAKIRLEGKKLIIEPVEDPLEGLKKNVKVEISDIESSISELRKLSEEKLREVSKERWC